MINEGQLIHKKFDGMKKFTDNAIAPLNQGEFLFQFHCSCTRFAYIKMVKCAPGLIRCLGGGYERSNRGGCGDKKSMKKQFVLVNPNKYGQPWRSQIWNCQ